MSQPLLPAELQARYSLERLVLTELSFPAREVRRPPLLPLGLDASRSDQLTHGQL